MEKFFTFSQLKKFQKTICQSKKQTNFMALQRIKIEKIVGWSYIIIIFSKTYMLGFEKKVSAIESRQRKTVRHPREPSCSSPHLWR